MRIAYQESYCRLASYRYEYDKTIGKPPDKKETFRFPYKNPDDMKAVNRTMIKKACDNFYDYMHMGMFDPLALKMKNYTTVSRSFITYKKYPLFLMIAGIVYKFDQNHYRYNTYPIEFFPDKHIAVVFQSNSNIPIAKVSTKKRYSYEVLEDCYTYIDLLILNSKDGKICNAQIQSISLDFEMEQDVIKGFE